MAKRKDNGSEFRELFESVEKAKQTAVEKIKTKLSELKDRKRDLTKEIDSQIDEAESMLNKLTGSVSRSIRGDGRSKRRSAEERKADAEKIVAFLKEHPGSSLDSIRALNIDFGQSLPKFISTVLKKELKASGGPANRTFSI